MNSSIGIWAKVFWVQAEAISPSAGSITEALVTVLERWTIPSLGLYYNRSTFIKITSGWINLPSPMICWLCVFGHVRDSLTISGFQKAVMENQQICLLFLNLWDLSLECHTMAAANGKRQQNLVRMKNAPWIKFRCQPGCLEELSSKCAKWITQPRKIFR